MTAFVTQLIDGVAIGSIYSLLAMSIVLVFRSTRVINVAQGEFATLSAFACWQLLQWDVPLLAAAVVSIGVSFVLGCAVQRTIVRRIEGRDHLTSIVVTIGMLIVINQVTGWLWGPHVRAFPSMFGQSSVQVGDIAISTTTLGTIGVMLAIGGTAHMFFARTRLGLGMRAAAENAGWSRLAGIPASTMFLLGWGLSLAIGAVSGMLAAPAVFLEPNMMLGISLYAFAAAALGGFDSLTGAIVGGVTVGVVENLAGAYVGWIGSDLKILVPLMVMFVVLLARPTGLFGSAEVTKV